MSVRIEKLASVVAGEGTPRPVGPAQSRRKADDRHARVRFAKGRNRRVPPVRIGRPVRGPERREPRTIRAIVRRADVERHAAVDALLAHFLDGLLDRSVGLASAMVDGTRRPVAGIASDPLDQVGEIDELIRLTAQFIRHHWRLG